MTLHGEGVPVDQSATVVGRAGRWVGDVLLAGSPSRWCCLGAGHVAPLGEPPGPCDQGTEGLAG